SKTSEELFAAVFTSGFTSSMLFASCSNLTFVRILRIWYSSDTDLIIIPLFFVGDPDVSTGLTSMTMQSGLLLKVGSLSKNTPGILVGFLSQSFPSFKNCVSLSSAIILLSNTGSLKTYLDRKLAQCALPEFSHFLS